MKTYGRLKWFILATCLIIILLSSSTALQLTYAQLPTISVSGASFAIPETLKDYVSSYRKAIPGDVLKLLPRTLPSESFILATPKELYLVFADQSDKGLAHVEGWRLPQDINLKGMSVGVIVAKSVTFEKEGAQVTISDILANPDNYKFKLVKINANRRQISVLYDSDEPPHVAIPITIGYLVEKPIRSLDVLKVILEKAGGFTLKFDEQFVKSLLETEEKERVWFFNLEYGYWYDLPAITNGIIIPMDHPVFKLINQSMPVIGKFANLEGKVVLYEVKIDIPYEEVSSVSELKANYDKYLGRTVKITVNCYGGYISIQEVLRECAGKNILVDVRLEGLVAWKEVSIPPKHEELLSIVGISNFHQDMLFGNVTGVFELIGRIVSTRQISESLPEDVALMICQARRVGAIDFEKLFQQVKDEIKGDVGELYWVLQNIYPYEKQPSIPYKLPKKVFNPKAPIFVKSSRDIPEIYVDKNFTINIAVASPETPIKLNITNSHISSISIVLKEVATNVTIFFEKLVDKPPTIPKPPGLVYAYHEISVNISKEALKGANITFWISKEWLTSNNATVENVRMLKYYMEKWIELPTRVVSENATHFKFNAETYGFSVFAITVKVVPSMGVEGYVKDDAGKPISNVRVIVLSKIATLGKISETSTDDIGHYLVEIPAGEYVLIFSIAGYADRSVNVSLKAGELKRVDVSLKHARTEFLKDWYGVKFEVALVTKEPWKVGGEANIEVWITVSDMGGNQRIEFRQLKVWMASIEKTIPLNIETVIGGTVYNSNISFTVLDGFELMEPDSSSLYSLMFNLEGSVIDRFGIAWPGLMMESTKIEVYAPPSLVVLSAEVPAKVTVGEEFEIKVKVKNGGEYPISKIKVELLLPFGTSAVSSLDWNKSILNPGEEAVATFKLKASATGTPSVSASLSYITLWGYPIYESKILGSITIEEKKACIIATAAYGSELDPHVQFLRSFRDSVVLKTFAGSKFMDVFNAWYYSFSPSIASFISSSETLRATVRGMLYPLIGILRLGVIVNDVFSFNSEVSVIIAGIVISALIGLVYFTPLTLLILYIVGRRIDIPEFRPKVLLASWIISMLLVVFAELTLSPTLMMIGSGALVLSTIALVTWTIALKATAQFLAHHNSK
jgi:PGF-pre-PGF domain-containing protein